MARFSLIAMMIFVIAPTADAQPSRIIFGSCADQNKKCPIWETMANAKPDLSIMLGDTIYADIEEGRLKPASPEKIAKCYKELNELESFKKFRVAAPMIGTWDDHDYGHNDAGVEWENKDIAQKHFLDFFNIADDSPRRKQKGVYHAEMYGPEGKQVQVILLDTRYFRSPLKKAERTLPGTRIKPYLPNTEADSTMLGEEQWKWLEVQLRKPAALRIIGSSIQVISDEHAFEKWGNIPNDRERLYKLVQDTNANGVVIISGDRHQGEISVDTKSISYPLYDVTSSGLNQASQTWRVLEPNKNRAAGLAYGNHFGMIAIDWTKPDPVVSLQLRHEDGEIAIQQRFNLSLLTAKAKAPPKVAIPAGVISASDALRKNVGDEVTVQFEVQAGRVVGTRILLNSEKDFRSEKNFTVVVNDKARTGKFEKATFETFQSKTIRVKGKISTFQNAMQIQIAEEKSIEIVDMKDE